MKYKKRYLEAQLVDLSKYFKVLLVLGARQVGKSTLLEHLFPGAKVFVFDPTQDLYGARRDPDFFLKQHGHQQLILDEIQYVPELLPALKRFVDKREDKGQFLLTGSQNLALLKEAAESMAGRVGIVDLEAMSLHELGDETKPEHWLQCYLKDPKNIQIDTPKLISSPGLLKDVLWRGCMPGVMEMPNRLLPTFFQSYISTYVDRDVRLVNEIRDITKFDQFLGMLGALTSQEINRSHIGREIGVTPTTAQSWLSILARTYQWVEIPPFSGNAIKRISGRSKGYLQDTGLASYLQRVSSPDALLVNPHLGAFFETWVVNQVRRLASTLNVEPAIYHWRTSAGAEVDLILEIDAKLYPIEMKCKSHVTSRDTRGIRAFVETYGKSRQVMPGLVIYAGETSYAINDLAWAIPWNAL